MGYQPDPIPYYEARLKHPALARREPERLRKFVRWIKYYAGGERRGTTEKQPPGLSLPGCSAS